MSNETRWRVALSAGKRHWIVTRNGERQTFSFPVAEKFEYDTGFRYDEGNDEAQRLAAYLNNLEQQLKTALEERDAIDAKVKEALGAAYAGRYAFVIDILDEIKLLSNPVGKEGSGGVPSSEVQDG